MEEQRRRGRVLRLIALLCCFAIDGCTAEMNEKLRRGEPGSDDYIAPDYRDCKVVAFEPEFVGEVAGRAAKRNAYSVIEDDRGRRYRVIGRVGEVGDEFSMDVSLQTEVK